MDINWTTVITQAIVSAGAVLAIALPVALPLWIRLHTELKEARKEMNGKLADLVATKEIAARAGGVIQEKVAQEVRQDAKSADDRKP